MTCSTKNDGKRWGIHEQHWALDRAILKATSNFSETFEFPFYDYSLHGTFKNFSDDFLHKKFEFSSLFVLGSRSRSQSRRYYLDSSSVAGSSSRESWVDARPLMSAAALSNWTEAAESQRKWPGPGLRESTRDLCGSAAAFSSLTNSVLALRL